MEKFIEDITSAYWWVAVVVVGVVINILSAYIRNGLETRLAKVSSFWAARKESREQRRSELIELLSTDKTALLLYAKNELRYRVRAVQSVVFSFIFMFMSTSVINMVVFDSLPLQLRLAGTLILMTIALLSLIGATSDLLASITVKKNISNAYPKSELLEN